MKNYQKFGLIAGQVYGGLGFGIIGLIVTALLVEGYFKIIGMHLDLFGGIMYALIGGYIGVPAGVGIIGYKFLKGNDRQKEFFKYFLQCLLGLILGFLPLYYLFNSRGNKIYGVIEILAVALPLSGAIIGFNFRLFPKKKRS